MVRTSLLVGAERNGREQRLKVLKALANETRLAILDYLGDRLVPVSHIARDLGLPLSTAAAHIAELERSGLLRTETRAATRGLQKVCARTYNEVVVQVAQKPPIDRQRYEVAMPVGAYSTFEVEPTCGLAGPEGLIGFLDDPASFYEPRRIEAQLLWFRLGWVEYWFPNRVPGQAVIEAVQFSAELCSEAPLHNPDWPSDITVWINDVPLGVWTSPGDFGGDRGRLTPDWWEDRDSQYGLLKRWRVTADGTSLDGTPLSEVVLDDLRIQAGYPIRVRIGVERTADHVGGLNLFGRGFGNYPQDLLLTIEYRRAGDGNGQTTGDREPRDAGSAH
jgi:predicted transcriptional regulator